jgi:hypothetical protein
MNGPVGTLEESPPQRRLENVDGRLLNAARKWL